MAIRIGNAASPRWYDLSLDRLDAFIAMLAESGARSTELVLHAGEADEATARVHVLESDWDDVSRRFQDRGFVCHAHAPLHPRFKLDRWLDDRAELCEAFEPVLAATARFAERQDRRCVFVLHGASGSPERATGATAEFAGWALDRVAGADVGFAFELRRPRSAHDRGFDRSRAGLASFVEGLADPRIGICWDVAHDWEGGRNTVAWQPEPNPSFLRLVSHVHLHGAGTFEGKPDVHFPVRTGEIPWQAMLSPLIAGGYDGSITIEARYRYARAVGDPWPVLAADIMQVRTWLDGLDRHRPADPVFR